MAGTVSKYSEIWLSPFFHGFPHIDLTFQYTNSSFNPENSRYREVRETKTRHPRTYENIVMTN